MVKRPGKLPSIVSPQSSSASRQTREFLLQIEHGFFCFFMQLVEICVQHFGGSSGGSRRRSVDLSHVQTESVSVWFLALEKNIFLECVSRIDSRAFGVKIVPLLLLVLNQLFYQDVRWCLTVSCLSVLQPVAEAHYWYYFLEMGFYLSLLMSVSVDVKRKVSLIFTQTQTHL